jgi:hypothetical protein
MANETPPQPPVTWAQAVRDIVVASINKGQLPTAIFGAVLLLLIWKLPAQGVAALVDRMLDGLQRWTLLGWALFIASVGGWYVHSRYQRRVMGKEIRRLSAERTKLQDTLGGGAKSSGG